MEAGISAARVVDCRRLASIAVISWEVLGALAGIAALPLTLWIYYRQNVDSTKAQRALQEAEFAAARATVDVALRDEYDDGFDSADDASAELVLTISNPDPKYTVDLSPWRRGHQAVKARAENERLARALGTESYNQFNEAIKRGFEQIDSHEQLLKQLMERLRSRDSREVDPPWAQRLIEGVLTDERNIVKSYFLHCFRELKDTEYTKEVEVMLRSIDSHIYEGRQRQIERYPEARFRDQVRRYVMDEIEFLPTIPLIVNDGAFQAIEVWEAKHLALYDFVKRHDAEIAFKHDHYPTLMSGLDEISKRISAEVTRNKQGIVSTLSRETVKSDRAWSLRTACWFLQQWLDSTGTPADEDRAAEILILLDRQVSAGDVLRDAKNAHPRKQARFGFLHLALKLRDMPRQRERLDCVADTDAGDEMGPA